MRLYEIGGQTYAGDGLTFNLDPNRQFYWLRGADGTPIAKGEAVRVLTEQVYAEAYTLLVDASKGEIVSSNDTAMRVDEWGLDRPRPEASGVAVLTRVDFYAPLTLRNPLYGVGIVTANGRVIGLWPESIRGTSYKNEAAFVKAASEAVTPAAPAPKPDPPPQPPIEPPAIPMPESPPS
jgi:hypothetical protein